MLLCRLAQLERSNTRRARVRVLLVEVWTEASRSRICNSSSQSFRYHTFPDCCATHHRGHMVQNPSSIYHFPSHYLYRAPSFFL